MADVMADYMTLKFSLPLPRGKPEPSPGPKHCHLNLRMPSGMAVIMNKYPQEMLFANTLQAHWLRWEMYVKFGELPHSFSRLPLKHQIYNSWAATIVQVPLEVVYAFFQGLSHMASLEELALTWFDGNRIISPKPLPTLQKLLFHGWAAPNLFGNSVSSLLPCCPNLEYLEVQDATEQVLNKPMPPTFLGALFVGVLEHGAPPHLRHLELIGIFVTPNDVRQVVRYLSQLETLKIKASPIRHMPQEWFSAAPILDILMREGIYLKELYLQEAGQPLPVSPYLFSYSGLNTLFIEQIRTDSTELLIKFPAILLSHSPFLHTLDLHVDEPLPRSSERWFDALRECISLRFLRVKVKFNKDDTVSDRQRKLVSSPLLLTSLKPAAHNRHSFSSLIDGLD
jgi:hypothetical protein